MTREQLESAVLIAAQSLSANWDRAEWLRVVTDLDTENNKFDPPVDMELLYMIEARAAIDAA